MWFSFSHGIIIGSHASIVPIVTFIAPPFELLLRKSVSCDSLSLYDDAWRQKERDKEGNRMEQNMVSKKQEPYAPMPPASRLIIICLIFGWLNPSWKLVQCSIFPIPFTVHSTHLHSTLWYHGHFRLYTSYYVWNTSLLFTELSLLISFLLIRSIKEEGTKKRV